MLITAVVWCAVNTLLLGVVAAVLWQKKSPCDHADEWRAISRRSEAESTELGRRLIQLDADLDDVYDRMKSLAARKGMRARREQEAEAHNPNAMQPGETPDQWKARMRRAKQNGNAVEV